MSDARVVCWGLFAAWAVHDLEEVLTATWWSRTTVPRLRAADWPGWLVDSLTTSTADFAVAVLVVGAAVLLVSWHGARAGGRSPVFQATVLVFGWHGLVHLGQAVVLRGYVPGLVAAILVVIPYAVWAWRFTRRIGGASRPSPRLIAGVAVAAVGLAFAGQALARLV